MLGNKDKTEKSVVRPLWTGEGLCVRKQMHNSVHLPVVAQCHIAVTPLTVRLDVGGHTHKYKHLICMA